MLKRFLCLMAVLACLMLPTAVSADLGNFNDYSSGSSGGSSSSGSYGGSGSSSYGSSYYVSGGYGDDGASGMDFVIGAIIVIGVIIYILKNNGGNGGTPSGGGNGGSNITVPDNTEEITAEVMKNDPEYSNTKFISWVKEVFITLQRAWSERDFEKVRPFEKEELYKQHATQIEEYKNKGWINKLERINVNQVYLYKYIKDKEYEYMTVYIQARMTDYIIDEKTNNVVKGSPNTDYHPRYLFTFIRKVGVLTDPAKSNKSVVACPHCGAPTQITSAGKCEYCGFIVTTGEFDWVLSDIEAIKAGSNIDRGGVVIRG